MDTVTLEGLKIGLCQLPCIPAQLEHNGAYFEGCIEDAEEAQVDLLVGPEGIQGYLIGDQYEYASFLRAVSLMNKRILGASDGKQVAIAYGSVISLMMAKGEDGRVKRKNGGYVIQNGSILRESNKTLSPNYRMFPEARYFFDNRKVAESYSIRHDETVMGALRELLQPVEVTLRDGRVINLGQTFCEDMWHSDYVINPTAILAANEADVIVNHSASPWTWRKNDKRHRVVKDLLQGIPEEHRPKLFIYVNRTGVEQSNKNFYLYDGSSAVYNGEGDLIYEVPPYYRGTKTFIFRENSPAIEPHVPDDTVALHDAIAAGIDDFFRYVPDDRRFVYEGLSGGIDSSLVTSLLVSRSVLGAERVVGVNMPYGNYNTQDTIDDAERLAKNLGILYQKIDITEMVDAIARATGIEKGTPAHPNIIARCRMEVLAGLAQKKETVNGLKKTGGFFLANSNKVEMAFGFGTMYADIAGALMPLGDLVKREVYQLADYLNREVYGREVIPQSVFERPPLAALDESHSADPFDYGSLQHRGYHDEWVRAVTEFRWDPERFLAEYVQGTLEKTLLLPPGRINQLFPTAKNFIERLHKDWRDFTRAYWKRMQSPPLFVFSRRAFGGDLAESLSAFDHRTDAFKQLQAEALRLAGQVTTSL
jgi:NAD+ synthase (glutamine-hydrolysing)